MLGLAWLCTPASPSYAATIVVATTTDELNTNGRCSLREAIRAANLDQRVASCGPGSGTDTITVPAGLYNLGIAGTFENAAARGDLDITSSMTIKGNNAEVTIVDGTMLDRVFDIRGRAVTSAHSRC